MKHTFFRSLLSSLLLLVLSIGNATPVFAAQLTGRSDVMTRQAPAIGSDHEIRFITPTGVDAPTDTITLQFASDFDLTGITAADIDLLHGPITGLEISETIAAAAAAGVWGAGVSGQTITLTAPTNAAIGEITATHIVTIRIGNNAGGANQIINPGPGAGGAPRTMWIAGTFGDTGIIEIPFAQPTNNDAIAITATVGAVIGGGGGGGGGCVGIACGDTQGPIISNIRVVNITSSTAMVLWDTDEPATTAFYYGLTTGYTGGFIGDGTLVTSHSVSLTNLTPETLYHFRINGTDGLGNTSVTLDNTFTTLALDTPVEALIISNVRSILITDSTAAITWNTNIAADSKVDYGISDAYGFVVVRGTLDTVHQLDLSGLTPNTTYHFRVTSETGLSSAATGDFVFQTLVDTNPPANPQNFVAVGDFLQNTLQWVNPNVGDFSHVRILARTDRYPNNPNDGVLVYQGNNQNATHNGLVAGQVYYYANFAYDLSGNRSSGALAQATPFGLTETPTSTPPLPTNPPVTDPGTNPGGENPTTGVVTSTPEVPTVTTTEPGTDITDPEKPEITKPPVQPPIQPPVRDIVITPVYTLGNGSVVLVPNTKNEINTVPGPAITVVVRSEEVPGNPETATILVGNDRYLLTKLPNGDWTASFVPDRSGQMPAQITFGYEDGSIAQATTTIITGVPGQVIERDIPFIGPARMVEGVRITVYQKVDGEWMQWSGAITGQEHPLKTKADGLWGFVVQNGEYRVLFEKEGYDTEEKIVTVTNNLLGYQVEISKPLPVDVNIIGIITTAVAIANIATVASLLNYLWYLLTQPFLIFGARKRKKWGVVYNSITKQGIDLVAVRLVHAKTGLTLQTRVTDEKGRYFFHVKPGQYKVVAVKAGYVFPSVIVKDVKEDDEYLDVYHSEEVAVEAEADLTMNIPMDPNNKEETPAKVLFKSFLRKMQGFVGALSLIITGIALILEPGWILLGLFLFQLATYLLFKKLIASRKPKNWGIVSDVDNKHPLERVVMRIYDKKYNKLLETQVTDGRGRYGFLATKNTYFITADKPGYDRFTSDDIDLTKAKELAVEKPVKLKKKNIQQ
ncbi:MAG TPA: hypothetical protein PLR08_02015 [bacterium]|nr:hypothetical protein [bacterium]